MATENGVNITVDKTSELLKAIQTLTKKQVLVGIPANSPGRKGDPVTNATLGYVHEFGSPANNIPARPFLYPTINRLREKLVIMLKQAADLQLERKPGEAQNQLEAIGILASQAVKANIVAGGDPRFQPLADSTIRQRTGFGKLFGVSVSPDAVKPLIDTGQLLASISYVVRDKG